MTKCPYCNYRAELSKNVETGNIFIDHNRQGNFYLNAMQAPEIGFDTNEFFSIDINYCPICGRKLNVN